MTLSPMFGFLMYTRVNAGSAANVITPCFMLGANTHFHFLVCFKLTTSFYLGESVASCVIYFWWNPREWKVETRNGHALLACPWQMSMTEQERCVFKPKRDSLLDMENNLGYLCKWRLWSRYGIYIVKPSETHRGWTFCAPMDDQSCLIVFGFVAAAVALILRHIPFKSLGQAFIAWAYQMDKESRLNNWTISYQGWHPYKDLPLTASAQTEGNE